MIQHVLARLGAVAPQEPMPALPLDHAGLVLALDCPESVVMHARRGHERGNRGDGGEGGSR